MIPVGDKAVFEFPVVDGRLSCNPIGRDAPNCLAGCRGCPLKLPAAEPTAAAREKIIECPLSGSNVRGLDKNRFFSSCGFHPDRRPEFAVAIALLSH